MIIKRPPTPWSFIWNQTINLTICKRFFIFTIFSYTFSPSILANDFMMILNINFFHFSIFKKTIKQFSFYIQKSGVTKLLHFLLGTFVFVFTICRFSVYIQDNNNDNNEQKQKKKSHIEAQCVFSFPSINSFLSNDIHTYISMHVHIHLYV